MKKKTQMLLSDVPVGKKTKLVSIDAGQQLKTRLASMGMVPNTEITVIKKGSPGPFIVNVKGSKIAIGKGMVTKITVEV